MLTKGRLHAVVLAISTCSIAATGSSCPAFAQMVASEDKISDGSGPYPATYVALPDLPNHVVYLPRDLTVLRGEKLPVYSFGNGGCSANGLNARNHMLEIASHGYLAIAPGVIPGPRREVPNPRQLPSGKLSADTPTAALTEAVEWAVAQNSTAGSPLEGLVATDQVAVSGWSCGGLQALNSASDPRVKTVVIMNSGIFNDEGDHIEGIPAKKSTLEGLHSPILYVLGGTEDGAQPNGLDDYRRVENLPAAVVDLPVGHGGTFHEKDGGTGAEVVVAWLDWILKGDSEAAAKFTGRDCGYCDDERFVLMRKNID